MLYVQYRDYEIMSLFSQVQGKLKALIDFIIVSNFVINENFEIV